MKLRQKTISITLSIISMVIIAMCTVLPIFSFWNYRLCMIPFALISILLFFTNIKERSKKVYILFACLVFLLSIIAFLLASGMEGVVISSVLSVYIAILLLLPNTNRVFPVRERLSYQPLAFAMLNSNTWPQQEQPQASIKVLWYMYSSPSFPNPCPPASCWMTPLKS